MKLIDTTSTPSVKVLLALMLLIFTLIEENNVNAAFGSRRHYHSYHHISQSTRGTRGRTRTNDRKTSLAGPVPALSSQEEVEQILEKAAQIRRRAALLDTDGNGDGYGRSTQLRQEVSQVQREINNSDLDMDIDIDSQVHLGS